MMKILYSKIIKRSICILFIVIILIYIIPFPINKKFDAIEIKLDDPSYLETRRISISGNYRFNLFTDNTFQGQIFVPEYELTSGKMDKIQFMKDIDNGCPLVYKNESGTIADGRPLEEYYSFGRILSEPLLHRMVILVYGQSKGDVSVWNSSTGYCIVPFVSNREEALKILKKYNIFSSE